MSYRPTNMQQQRFMTEVWADGMPKLQIVSSSWKSMFEQERFDRAYSDFVAALHRSQARAGTFLYVPRGVEIDLPIEAFHWLHGSGGSCFPHTA